MLSLAPPTRSPVRQDRPTAARPRTSGRHHLIHHTWPVALARNAFSPLPRASGRLAAMLVVQVCLRHPGGWVALRREIRAEEKSRYVRRWLPWIDASVGAGMDYMWQDTYIHLPRFGTCVMSWESGEPPRPRWNPSTSVRQRHHYPRRSSSWACGQMGFISWEDGTNNAICLHGKADSPPQLHANRQQRTSLEFS